MGKGIREKKMEQQPMMLRRRGAGGVAKVSKKQPCQSLE